MTILVTILLFIFLAVYLSHRRHIPLTKLRLRAFLLSISMSVVVYLQLFFFTHRENVNYGRTGWLGMIHYMNRHFSAIGMPYRLPEP